MRLVLALLAVPLLVPGLARAQWTEPETVAVSPQQGCACDQKLAMDARGRGVVVWERLGASGAESSVVLSRDIAADGSLSAPVQVSPRGLQAHDSRLAVADDGSAAILFGTGGRAGVHPEKREIRTVRLVTRAPGGTWSKPRTLSTGGRNFAKSVVIEPSGRIVAAWTHSRNRRRDAAKRVEVRRLSADGRRSLSITRLPYGTVAPSLAASPAFPRAALAYLVTPQPSDAGPRTVRLRVGDRDWKLDTGEDRRAVAIAAADRLTVAWGHYSLDHPPDLEYQLRSAVLAPGAAAPEVEIRDEGDGPIGSPSLGAEGRRTALAWTGSGVRLAQAQAGLFGDPTTLDPEGTGAGTRIGGGRLVTAWVGPRTMPRVVDGQLVFERLTAPLRASVGDAGGSPGPVETVVATDNPDFFRLAVSEDGTAVIVYRTTDLLAASGRQYTLRMVRLSP